MTPATIRLAPMGDGTYLYRLAGVPRFRIRPTGHHRWRWIVHEIDEHGVEDIGTERRTLTDCRELIANRHHSART